MREIKYRVWDGSVMWIYELGFDDQGMLGLYNRELLRDLPIGERFDYVLRIKSDKVVSVM